MFENIKYVWEEFKKKPFLVITFGSLLVATFFGYKWVNSFKVSETKIASYEARIIQKDSIILVITANYARAEALNEVYKNIKEN